MNSLTAHYATLVLPHCDVHTLYRFRRTCRGMRDHCDTDMDTWRAVAHSQFNLGCVIGSGARGMPLLDVQRMCVENAMNCSNCDCRITNVVVVGNFNQRLDIYGDVAAVVRANSVASSGITITSTGNNTSWNAFTVAGLRVELFTNGRFIVTGGHSSLVAHAVVNFFRRFLIDTQLLALDTAAPIIIVQNVVAACKLPFSTVFTVLSNVVDSDDLPFDIIKSSWDVPFIQVRMRSSGVIANIFSERMVVAGANSVEKTASAYSAICVALTTLLTTGE